MALLKKLNVDGLSVVLVTHDPAIASQAQRILRMRDGRLLPEDEATAAGAR